MLRYLKPVTIINQRSFKNFGHKRQPIPVITTLWHGFLTFSFIGLGIEWKRIRTFLFGADEESVFVNDQNSVTENS
ncbi:unnamed protein product [Spodoptera littoralis]|uniref:Uncharacterized protein n=1 Tax=Spodoptera littoralis TaxID=7109 RepID=A0A9P0ICD9_SPOLI|nr:unnamed protein product [Spodoptera littoralis]